MTDRTHKIGDVVTWGDVPDGALVLVQQERFASLWLRLDREIGFQVGFMLGIYTPMVRLFWSAACPRDPADRRRAAKATIIALGLTGEETARELQRLAEIYEVGEAWTALMMATPLQKGNAATVAWFMDDSRDARLFIESLRDAGWRPGDDADRATILLRMHERVQVGEGDEALFIPAWEVARDLVECPVCEAPQGYACASGDDCDMRGEVHVERLEAEQRARPPRTEGRP